MPIPWLLVHRFYQHLLSLRSYALILVIAGYTAGSWILLAMAGETALVQAPVDFVYFMATTGSTVGYGDLSPQTDSGKLVATLWLYPGGILIFSLAVGKIGSEVVDRMQRVAKGLGDFSGLEGATVLIGYHPERTPMMIDDIRAGKDGDKDIILLTRNDAATLPADVHKIYAERLDAEEALMRAAVPQAEKVLIYTENDAETLNASLAVRELNRQGHVVAFFQDRATARRAETLANIAPVISVSTEMLVRAAQDPGAEKVVMALTAATDASTIFSNILPAGTNANTAALRDALYDQGAVLTAILPTGRDDPQFAPFDDTISEGGSIFYIARARIDDTAFTSMIRG